MKRLVLLGGGHAHLFVLEAFAREQPDARVSLITPDALTPYSGMMPGVIAGHYDYRQACIDLAPLAARAGCALPSPSGLAGIRMLPPRPGAPALLRLARCVQVRCERARRGAAAAGSRVLL